MTNHTRLLYIGFTSKYFLERLVYCEDTNELKGWRRSKKIALVQTVKQWSDLSRDLIGWKGRGEPGQIASRRSLTHTP